MSNSQVSKGTQITKGDQITKAAQILTANDVVAFPTETVYGLGARIDSEIALKKIFTIKQRPFFDPLIVHVSSVAQAESCTSDFNPLAKCLAAFFWPGPLTLILPKSDLISPLITSGLADVGIRFPSHPVAQELINMVGVPLAAPSANKFGRTSPTTAQHVQEEFGADVFVIDGKASEIGIESTVLAIKKDQHEHYRLCILRKGYITRSQIDALLIKATFTYSWDENWDKKLSPGHMKHHYMPLIPFVICRNQSLKLSQLAEILNEKLNSLPDEVEGVKIIKPKGIINKIEFLKLPSDPIFAARELYSLLRSASLRGPQVLCFIQLPSQSGEMWESVFDRLYKAASLILD